MKISKIGEVIFLIGDPEFVGKFPVQTEITVMPADKCESKKIGWVCREYFGAEVYALDSNNNPIYEPILNKMDLYPGKRILAPTLFGSVMAEVIENKEGKFQAITEGGHTLIFLEFARDDRECWTSCGAANLRGIKKSFKEIKIT